VLRLIGCIVRLIGLIRISHCMRNTTRLNVHVKSRLMKGRNVLCIRFLVSARILCMLEKHGETRNTKERTHEQSQTYK